MARRERRPKPKKPKPKHKAEAVPILPNGTLVQITDPRYYDEVGTIVDHKHAWYHIQVGGSEGIIRSVRVMYLKTIDLDDD